VTRRYQGAIAVLTVVVAGLTVRAQTEDMAQWVADHPVVRALAADPQQARNFRAYIAWLEDKAPDASLVAEFLRDERRPLDALAVVIHEQVEFREWQRLGHAIDDIMTVEYYREQYPTVYPIAHRRAIEAEFDVIAHAARRLGFSPVPALAYNLVSPLLDHHGVPPDRLHRRLRFNEEIAGQAGVVTREHLEVAIAVFERGGHSYGDRDQVLKSAEQLLETLLSALGP
jgi:hypothetical protein